MTRRRVARDLPYPHEGKTFSTKCGWCMDDRHAQCREPYVSTLTRANYVCSCDCQGSKRKKARTTKGAASEE